MNDTDTQSFLLPVAGFQARKAAQIAAYLATMAGEYGIEKLKLIKLIYLSERTFLQEHGLPMIFDELYSLPHGPICSSALNGIDGRIQQDIWEPLIFRHGNLVYPQSRMSRDDLDEVSDAELATIDEVWGRFETFTASQIRNWTHKNCREYVEVGPNSRLPIQYAELLEAVGFERGDAEDVEREIQVTRKAESLLAA